MCIKLFVLFSGFVNGRELSEKTMTLFELCCRMLGTNVFISENISMGKFLIKTCKTIVGSCNHRF